MMSVYYDESRTCLTTDSGAGSKAQAQAQAPTEGRETQALGWPDSPKELPEPQIQPCSLRSSSRASDAAMRDPPQDDTQRRIRPATQPPTQPLSQPATQPASQPHSQPAAHQVSQPHSQPASHTASQPASHTAHDSSADGAPRLRAMWR